jgi:hypothetical protein
LLDTGQQRARNNEQVNDQGIERVSELKGNEQGNEQGKEQEDDAALLMQSGKEREDNVQEAAL